MTAKLPETLEELCDYICEYADYIFVRCQVDGKWGSYSLSELPATEAIQKSLTFVKEGRIPCRVLRDSEVGK